MTISDGNASTMAIYFKKENEDVMNNYKQFDIIQIKEALFSKRPDGKVIIIFKDVSIEYSGLTEAIGGPISYEKYKLAVNLK